MATRAQARYEIKAIDKTKRAFFRIGQSLNEMKAKAKAAGVTLAALGVAAAVGMVAASKNALQTAASFKQLSTKTGEAVGPLQRVQKILNAIGKGDQAADTITDLIEALGEARTEPGGEKGEAFGRLGIDPNKVRNIFDLLRKLSAAYDKTKDKSQFLFNVKDLSDSAGEAVAAIGGSFKELAAATKGTILDQATIDAAARSMMQFRVISDQITTSLQAGILNSAAMAGFQAALDRVFKVLGKQGIQGALAEIANILIETFPRATSFAFEQFAQAKKDIEDIARVINQVGTAIGTGVGFAEEQKNIVASRGVGGTIAEAAGFGLLADLLREVIRAVNGVQTGAT